MGKWKTCQSQGLPYNPAVHFDTDLKYWSINRVLVPDSRNWLVNLGKKGKISPGRRFKKDRFQEDRFKVPGRKKYLVGQIVMKIIER